MKRKTRIISLILALCLLSACCKTEQRRPDRYVLVPERTEFGDVELAGNAVMLGGEIYFLGSEDESGVGIYAVPASGGSPRRLEGYSPTALPAGSVGETKPLCLSVTAGGRLAVAEERLCSERYGAEGALYASSSDLTLYPYAVYRQDEFVRVLNADGSEASRTLINGDSRGGWSYFTVRSFAVDAQGRVYIAADDQLLVRDASGELRWLHFERELASVEELYLAGDGHVYVFGRGYDGQGRFYYVNPEGKRGPELRLIGTSDGAGDFCGAVGGFVSAYIDGAMLYGWEPASGITAEMLDLAAMGILPGSVRAAFETESGYVCVGSESTTAEGAPVAYMTVVRRTPESEAPRRTALTYACLGLGDASLRCIVEFNRAETEYCVTVRDYSRYSSDAEPGEDRRRFEADLLAGRAGDILNCSGVSTAAAAARGRLAELGALLEGDAELKNALVKPVLAAFETDGGLYTLPTRFSVLTAFGPAGLNAALSYDAALAARGTGRELFEYGTTGPGLLLSLVGAEPDRYIDWAEGKGRFDGGDFAALLDFCAAFPAESAADSEDYLPEGEQSSKRIHAGRQLLLRTELRSPSAAWGLTELFSGAALTGLPGAEGGFTAAKAAGAELAISSGCAHADAAWRLVRELVKAHSAAGGTGLPIVMERLDALITQEMADGMSEADATLLYRAIDAAGTCARTLPAGLAELIDTAAAPYFAGEASAEETAAALNRQVSAFFSELG